MFLKINVLFGKSLDKFNVWFQGSRGPTYVLLSGSRSQMLCLLTHWTALQDQTHLIVLEVMCNMTTWWTSKNKPWFISFMHKECVILTHTEGACSYFIIKILQYFSLVFYLKRFIRMSSGFFPLLLKEFLMLIPSLT